ncbi:MAG TPA: VOC family protein [Blastocatellia bacterium]|nr:VOC family protein [Blastocatellia bacterium]
MAKSKTPIPEGFTSLTIHLTVDGASNYIDFLKRALNAVEIGRAPGPGGKILHADVKIGDSHLMLNDYFPEFGFGELAKGNLPFVIALYVPDADAAFEQALAAGCQVAMPLADQFWGDRYGQVVDPFGFRWSIATRVEDLTQEEMKERQEKMFGGAAGA